MNLQNNELTYEVGEVPVNFSFMDWKYLVISIKAVSTKITAVEQRGIYQNDPPRFAVVISEELTEQEKADVISAWANFDATTARTAEKKIATEELRIQLGIKTKAYMGYLCEVNNLAISDFESMLADPVLTMLDRLLLSGALESSYGILDVYTPTSYFVENFKTALLAKLSEHIAQVNSFIAE